MSRWYLCLRAVVLRPAVATALIWLGLFAGLWGLIDGYGRTFARYPAWQWPFRADGPLFAMLFAVSLALLLVGRSWTAYNALVALGLVKYGVWAVVMWSLFWARGGALNWERVAMLVAHAGLVLEGLFLVSFLRMSWPAVLYCALWFGTSDWMDYGPFQTHPSLPRGVPLAPMQWHTVALTALLVSMYAYMAWRRPFGLAGEGR